MQNISLADYSTMGLGGPAAYLAEVTNRQEVMEAANWASQRNLPAMMIGDGSNIVFQDSGFPGLVMVNRIMSYKVQQIDDVNHYLTIGAGENWDSVVERSVAVGLTGIEALSLIPGTAGATPVQNVGAYGQEISETLVTVEAFDTQTGEPVTLAGMDCGFSYRSSRFKTGPDRGRFYIMGITLHLTKGNPQPPFYSSVEAYFNEQGVTDYTPAALRQAVIAIRRSKLPDPAEVRNTGSFFANPIISRQAFNSMSDNGLAIPSWPVGDDKVKLSAAWLIEQAGFKDYHDKPTGMATWPRQPLVLVNEYATSTAALLSFRDRIIETVRTKFGINLEQEPELLP